MPGPIEATGAVRNPTKYGALTMGARQFTGLWTQRVPYRDAAVEYLVSKFYSGSRFDSLLDGLNREISQRMSSRRRPGCPSATGNYTSFGPGDAFFAYKSIQNGVEVIRVLYDSGAVVYDITPSLSNGNPPNILFPGYNKPARFLGINSTLFCTKGPINEKWLYYAPWQASTSVPAGTLITEGQGQTSAGTVYMAMGGITVPIIATQAAAGTSAVITLYFNQQLIPDQFANLLGVNITISGLTAETSLNGVTKPVTAVLSSTLGILTIQGNGGAGWPYTPETAGSAQATTGTGTTGATIPSFAATEFSVTPDAGQQWKSYGSAVKTWQVATPPTAPKITPINGTRIWQPNTTQTAGQFNPILDQNGNIQIAFAMTAGATSLVTGNSYPLFQPYARTQSSGPQQTVDGTIVWWNVGPLGRWVASNSSYQFGYVVILDSNQNIQLLVGGPVTGPGGATQPTWATAINATTTDGAYTWQCLGPGAIISYGPLTYAYSWHGIDGSVSTASPTTVIQGGVLGAAGSGQEYLILYAASPELGDSQMDQIWIWRTASGQATLIYEDAMAFDQYGGELSYYEQGIPDTSTAGNGALNALIAAPVDDAANVPPTGMTAPVFHLQRPWAIYQNTVIYAGGPDTVTGNGYTAWPPANVIPFPCQPIKLIPITVENGGLLVMTTDGIWIILGTGTAANPFYATLYFSTVSVSGYNAIDVYNNSVWLMESNGKVSNVAIEYPFNPQSGYNEVGFPIGDQFVKVTTGGQNASLFNPATATLSWCVSSSADTAMYVADGAVGWFRGSFVNQPESGFVWSPFAAVLGGTSVVQAVETSTGTFQLLIGGPAIGTLPIRARDTTGTVWTDLYFNGSAFVGGMYDSYDVKGVILLCSTGQWAEVRHISAKSLAAGARPAVSVLLNEIAPSTQKPYAVLALGQKSNDPSKTPRSVSVYSDRYLLLQNGMNTRGDCILVKFDYGSQAVGDELLDWAIYAAVHDELEEEVAK